MAKKKQTKRKTTKRLPEPTEDMSPLPEIENELLRESFNHNTKGVTLKRVTSIDEFIADVDSVAKFIVSAEAGNSVQTIGAALGLPPNMLEQWLRNGAQDASNSQSFNSAYSVLYMVFSQAVATARGTAETTLLQKNPAKWLETYDPMLKLVSNNPSVSSSGEPEVPVEERAKGVITNPSTGVGSKVFNVPETKKNTEDGIEKHSSS